MIFPITSLAHNFHTFIQFQVMGLHVKDHIVKQKHDILASIC